MPITIEEINFQVQTVLLPFLSFNSSTQTLLVMHSLLGSVFHAVLKSMGHPNQPQTTFVKKGSAPRLVPGPVRCDNSLIVF